MSETTEEEVMEIAGRLTKTQRRYLRRAGRGQSVAETQARELAAMGLIFQPASDCACTHSVLGRRVASVLGDAK
jgi:hypothetical protein